MAGRKKTSDVSLPAKKPRRRGVTKDELKGELSRFATREEIDAKFATKDDLAAAKDELKAEIAKCATKDELKAELAKFATKDELKAEIAKCASKDDLANAKSELGAEIARCATKDELKAEATSIGTEIAALQARMIASEAGIRADLVAMEARLENTIARHIKAAMEEVRAWFRTLDDKYRDLPARVTALEARAEK